MGILKINNDSQAEEKRLTNFANILINVCIAIFIGAIIMFAAHQHCDMNSPLDTGLFGNMGSFLSGTIGVIFTLISVILFYTAIRMQREELVLQRTELELQREEMKRNTEELAGQKRQLEAQNKTMMKQSFESTFFQLLNVHSNIVGAMDLRDVNRDIIAQGRDCFKIFNNKIRSEIPHYKNKTLEFAINKYNGFYKLHDGDLGHYFRNLYNIIKFVENSDIEDKKTYTNFVRAQLSNYELIILFYNGLSSYGNEKFKPLIEKYSILKNMEKEHIANENFLEEYDRKAYGNEE